MKNVFRLTLMSVLLSLLSLAAFAGTTPDTMHISCEAPNPDHQTGLHRAKGDSDIWIFQIALEDGARFVDGPHWNYPGQNGSDPAWGLWTGGEDGDSSLGWSSPEKADSFAVGVYGQIVCGDGGDGEPIDFSAGWEGEVSYNAEIKVRRKDSGDEYSSSATVAAGGFGSDEHKADVKVIATDSDGGPIEGISVKAPSIQNDDDYVDRKANVSPSSATTNSDGEALFTFTSSDIAGTSGYDVTLRSDGGESADSATITQVWTQLANTEGDKPTDSWAYEDDFEYNIASPITFRMALNSNGDLPIRGHDIQIVISELDGFKWNPSTGMFDSMKYLSDDIPTSYSTLIAPGLTAATSESSPGIYTMAHTIDYTLDFMPSKIEFKAVDMGVYE